MMPGSGRIPAVHDSMIGSDHHDDHDGPVTVPGRCGHTAGAAVDPAAPGTNGYRTVVSLGDSRRRPTVAAGDWHRSDRERVGRPRPRPARRARG
eukprot:766703-Hanusia_phi.AAC.2